MHMHLYPHEFAFVYTHTRKCSFIRAYMPYAHSHTCLCADLIKTQNRFAHKIFQHSNALWVQKLSGCTIAMYTAHACSSALEDALEWTGWLAKRRQESVVVLVKKHFKHEQKSMTSADKNAAQDRQDTNVTAAEQRMADCGEKAEGNHEHSSPQATRSEAVPTSNHTPSFLESQ